MTPQTTHSLAQTNPQGREITEVAQIWVGFGMSVGVNQDRVEQILAATRELSSLHFLWNILGRYCGGEHNEA